MNCIQSLTIGSNEAGNLGWQNRSCLVDVEMIQNHATDLNEVFMVKCITFISVNFHVRGLECGYFCHMLYFVVVVVVFDRRLKIILYLIECQPKSCELIPFCFSMSCLMDSLRLLRFQPQALAPIAHAQASIWSWVMVKAAKARRSRCSWRVSGLILFICQRKSVTNDTKHAPDRKPPKGCPKAYPIEVEMIQMQIAPRFS